MTGCAEDDPLRPLSPPAGANKDDGGSDEGEEVGLDEVISPSSSTPSPYSTTTVTSSSFEIVPMLSAVKNGDACCGSSETPATKDCDASIEGAEATEPRDEEKRVQFMLDEPADEDPIKPIGSTESAKSTLLPLPPLVPGYKKRRRWAAGGADSAAHAGAIQRLIAGRMRYAILLISILSMTFTRSNDLSFNFTVICMTANSSTPLSLTEGGDEPIAMRPGEISAIFGGSGIGAIAMVLPVVYALHYAGPRLVFTALMCGSAVATAALAPLARIGPMWMVPARIVQGMAISSVLPLMGCISSEWAPISEIGKFMTILSSPGQLAQIVAMPLSAQLCVTSGWSSVYYVHGAISACCALVFFLCYRSSPRKHPWVNEAEMDRITQGVQPRRKRERRVPYRAILFSRPVWAVWIAFLGNSFGFQLIVQFMPTFLNKVLHVPIARTGLVAIIPPISQLGVKLLAGWGSDKLKRVDELAKLRVFNTLAMCGCGVCLLPLGYLPVDSGAVYALFCFTASVSCLGMVSVGSMKSATLVARNLTHFVMGVVQLVVCIGMLLVPAIVSWLAPDNTIEGWRNVFFLVFSILFVTNLFFCRFCSAEPETWAVSCVTRPSLPGLDEAVALASTGDALVPEGVVKRGSEGDDEEEGE